MVVFSEKPSLSDRKTYFIWDKPTLSNYCDNGLPYEWADGAVDTFLSAIIFETRCVTSSRLSQWEIHSMYGKLSEQTESVLNYWQIWAKLITDLCKIN